MERRNLLQILAISSAADFPAIGQHHSHASASADVNLKTYRPRLLRPDEYSFISAFCDILIPADADSGGALDAGVPYYIDTVLFYSEAPAQTSWHADLQRLRTWVSQRFRSDLSGLDKSGRTDAMAELLRNEQSPSSDLDFFIVRLK